MRYPPCKTGKLCAVGVALLGLVISTTVDRAVAVSPGSDVFRQFTGHISEQIGRDKQAFYVAQSCTSWFYKRHQKPSAPSVSTIAYHFVTAPPADIDCSTRYPKGLDEAREAFSETQQSLSLSLTFFEFALVGDRNDDRRYGGDELRDVLESFGETFEAHLPSARYLTSLTRVFDTLIDRGEIEPLTTSMTILLKKGYRFTHADQEALNRELN